MEKNYMGEQKDNPFIKNLRGMSEREILDTLGMYLHELAMPRTGSSMIHKEFAAWMLATIAFSIPEVYGISIEDAIANHDAGLYMEEMVEPIFRHWKDYKNPA